MPPTLSKPSSAASASLFYITLGALLTVWSGIWYIYLRNNPPEHPASHYFCYGFLGTGLVLLGIGLALGPLARLARHAELPPTDGASGASKVQPNATVTSAPASDRV